MEKGEHRKLHNRLRREGKCNIPVEELDKISTAAHNRTDKAVRYQHEYYKTHKEEIHKTQYEYYQTNKEKIDKIHCDYRETHKNEIREHRCEYRKTHKDEIRRNQYEYQKNNIQRLDFNETVCRNIVHVEQVGYNHNTGNIYVDCNFRINHNRR